MKASTFKHMLDDIDTPAEDVVIVMQVGDEFVIPGIVKEIKHDGQTFLILTDDELSDSDLVSLEIEEMTTGNEFVKINNQNDEDNNEN